MYALAPTQHFRKLHPWIVRLQSATNGLNTDIAEGNRQGAIKSLEDVWFWIGRVMCDLIGSDEAALKHPEVAVQARDALFNAVQVAAKARPLISGGSSYGAAAGTRQDVAQAAVGIGTQAAITGVQLATSSAGMSIASANVAGFLSTAGISVSIPVAGWIVAASAVTAAAIIQFVGIAKRKQLRTDQAVALGQQLGFPEIAAYPAWALDAMTWGPNRLKFEGERLDRKVKKGRGRDWTNRSKLSFIGVLYGYDIMEKRRAAGLPGIAPSKTDIARVNAMSMAAIDEAKTAETRQRQMLWLIGGATLLTIGVIVVRRL